MPMMIVLMIMMGMIMMRRMTMIMMLIIRLNKDNNIDLNSVDASAISWICCRWFCAEKIRQFCGKLTSEAFDLFVHILSLSMTILSLLEVPHDPCLIFCAQLQCCGSAGPLDWALSVHNGYTINTKVDILSMQPSGNHYHHHEKRTRFSYFISEREAKICSGCSNFIGFEHPQISYWTHYVNSFLSLRYTVL